MIKIVNIEAVPSGKKKGFGFSGVAEIAKNDVIKFSGMPTDVRCAEITTQHKNRKTLATVYRKACKILTDYKVKLIVRKERLFLVK